MAIARSTGFSTREPLALRAAASSKPDVASWPFLRFCALYGIVTYADFFNLLGYSTSGIGAAGKYAFFLILILAFAHSWLRTRNLRFGFDAPTILLCFTFFALVPFFAQLATEGDTNSYASAFIPTLILSTAITHDPSEYSSDLTKLRDRLLQWLCVLCLLYDVELFVRAYSGLSYFSLVANQTNHLKSIVFVAALALAHWSRRSAFYLTFILLLALVSEILRPSSTLLLAMAVCAPLSFFMRHRFLSAAKLWSYGLLAIAALAPIGLYLSQDLSQWVASLDEAAKSDALGGSSNAVVRLTIMKVAFQRIEDSSWLVGEFFSGGTTVQVANLLSFWTANYASGLAQIHSDYVCILLEGGLIGYGAFNLALLASARAFIQGADGAASRPRTEMLATGVVTLSSLAIYCSVNPVLQSFQVASIPWTILLCSYVALRTSVAKQMSTVP
ncbi:hypothetical protein JQ596_30485 [Bradyrhizobium manausense]|uniref:hypothetical protein n=1 Tax=Bradyrhizobium manausense TaxID=989370 RepID=UPI001BAA48DE|nr:hypothetical protein [Bradyrhizobium manausense]MBR0829865.1 hypothetical protein [Bradyrhizobium manausense]